MFTNLIQRAPKHRLREPRAAQAQHKRVAQHTVNALVLLRRLHIALWIAGGNARVLQGSVALETVRPNNTAPRIAQLRPA